MIFSVGFVVNPSPQRAFCVVPVRQIDEQSVSVSMPILKQGDAPQ
jgi:hypothetical protein